MATIDDVNIDFLPIIYDIVRCIEREMNEAAQAQKTINREQNDCHQKIISLKEKFQKCRETIAKIDGIEYRKDEQLNKLEEYYKQLMMKKELLLRYKHCCPIDSLPKLYQ